MWRRDGSPELGIPPTGSSHLGFWRSSGLVDRRCVQKARPSKTDEGAGVQSVTGEDLAGASKDEVMGETECKQTTQGNGIQI